MKHYLISEIIYWVIAIISIFSFFENRGINDNRAYIFLGFSVLSVFMALLEDILEENIQRKIK
tara:strand:- start:386 stop:574 length:189 start_codon:yes stop_codon:yes gene_type:complete